MAEPGRADEKRGFLARIFGNPKLVRFGARLAASYAPRVLKFRGSYFVFRWDDVASVLDRDGEFRIAPVNGKKIEAVSGPFILGMDRSHALFDQRRVLYGAMKDVDPSLVRAVLETEPARLIAQSREIDAVNGYARLVAARVAAAFFGISGPSEADLMRVARAVFHETFLNLGDDPAVRAKGIAAGQELNVWIAAEIARRRREGIVKRDLLGALMNSEAAGEISAAQAGHILSGLLVGSIDTTATCVANIMAELVADPKLMAMVKPDASNLPRLRGWCREILRRRPHNPLVLREAAAGASIAGRAIPAGARVFAMTLSAMQDKRVFDKPRRLDPMRPPERYMHFGRGLHLCSGRDINAIQIPALVGALLRAGPSKSGAVKFAGPFPDELVVRLAGEAP